MPSPRRRRASRPKPAGTRLPDRTRAPGQEVLLGGRYLIQRELGRGAMGTVYLAEDQALDGLKVAIKMPASVLARNPRAIEMLKHEALLAHKLSHPHIVTLRAFETSGEGVYLVMDYVEGTTLDGVLAKAVCVPERFVFEVFQPLAEALDYAHREGIVHRDVKPGNVMIRQDGRPLLTDFGIARNMKDSFTRVTGRSTAGTLPYMSPEQLRGHPPTPAQDVYSLAATMYECLAGHPPFYRGEIAFQVATVNPPPPTGQRSRLGDAIMQGLSKDPTARPATCAELLRLARGPAPWSLRGGRRSLVAALLLLLTVGAVAALWKPWRKTPTSTDSAGTASVASAPRDASRQSPASSKGGAQPPRAAHAAPEAKAPKPREPRASLPVPAPQSDQAPRRPVPPAVPVEVTLVEPAAGAWIDGRVIAVRGTVQGDVRAVWVNDRIALPVRGVFHASVSAEADGRFAIRVTSRDGRPLAERAVWVDATRPVIDILSPRDARVVLAQPQGVVRGRVVEENLARLTVDGRTIERDADGTFSWSVQLPEDRDVTVRFAAVDRAGNEAPAVTRTLRYEKPEEAWEAPLADAMEAAAREDWRAARAHMERVPPERRPKSLVEGVRRWEAKPVLAVARPAHGERVLGRQAHVEGRLKTGRKDDAVYVNGVRVTVRDGHWLHHVPGEPGGALTVRVEVRDGSEVRASETRQVTFARAIPSWAESLLHRDQVEAAARLDVAPAFQNELGMRFVLIPAGAFWMGSPTGEKGRDTDETRHRVRISRPFYMQVNEVTNAQYRRLVRAHDSGIYERHSLNGATQPVVNVNYYAAEEFARKLGRADGERTYRLPTEAEWEYAARAGTTGRFFWGSESRGGERFGNAMDPVTRLAFDLLTVGWRQDDGHRVSAPIGSFAPNAWGLSDMAGNVNEWCSDWYAAIRPGAVTDPRGPSRSGAPIQHVGPQPHQRGPAHAEERHMTGPARVVRGGAWNADPDLYLRPAARMWMIPSETWNTVGFRLVSPIPSAR